MNYYCYYVDSEVYEVLTQTDMICDDGYLGSTANYSQCLWNSSTGISNWTDGTHNICRKICLNLTVQDIMTHVVCLKNKRLYHIWPNKSFENSSKVLIASLANHTHEPSNMSESCLFSPKFFFIGPRRIRLFNNVFCDEDLNYYLHILPSYYQGRLCI